MVFAKIAEVTRMGGELSSSGNSPASLSADSAANSAANTVANGVANSSEDSSQDLVKCPHCGTVFAGDAAFCPHCKWRLTPLSLGQRAAAAVAYLPVIPAVVILFLPAFRVNRFVRFHAWQSITLWVVFLVLSGAALLLSNVAAAMVFLIFGILASLAMLFLWIVLSVKAWQGERFEVPLFGKLAARLS
jgi:uncharacterized membrane protein